jgi:hypothetical protein
MRMKQSFHRFFHETHAGTRHPPAILCRTVMPEKDTCNHLPPAAFIGGRRLMKVGSKN